MTDIYTHYLAGDYLGCAGSFTSGAVVGGAVISGPSSYSRTIGHLVIVLGAADGAGNSHWGHQGVSVREWRHNGCSLVTEGEPLQLTTFASLEAFLRLHGI